MTMAVGRLIEERKDSMLYMRFWNTPRRLIDRPGIWRPKLSTYAPGHVGDPKNRRPGGLRRFERWQRLPVAAWKLYWRSKTPNEC